MQAWWLNKSVVITDFTPRLLFMRTSSVWMFYCVMKGNFFESFWETEDVCVCLGNRLDVLRDVEVNAICQT